MIHRCKTRFYTFFIQGTFFNVFNVFFILPSFLFLKTFIENTIWNHFRNNGNKSGLYDCFSLCHVRISISTYILTYTSRHAWESSSSSSSKNWFTWHNVKRIYHWAICAMLPLCKIINTPVMSICLVKQNDGTWVEKHQRFLFNVYKRFCYFCHVFTFFLTFFYLFLERFLHLWYHVT